MKNPASAKPERPTDESAEALAVAILTWLSAEPSLMGRFLAISGVDQPRNLAKSVTVE